MSKARASALQFCPSAGLNLEICLDLKGQQDRAGCMRQWSSKAIKSFAMSELEARKLKYPTTGTGAFLLGVLVEGTSLASQFLRANGITLLKVRDETLKLLGKADMFFFSPEHPPLTDDAQRALDWAVDQKIKSGWFLSSFSFAFLFLHVQQSRELFKKRI
ncbi:hypothetical protein L6164_019559 [Bauhinia variegata]|uniref:Uncharacterized protein n=1 Tax=Bauhinia variegata TaxID=167791 RepID=A0ACB9MTL7_BAUVA|nr:hypothetical protein L6164_019559 [Bauhinia variegata]